jgi:hypothetical protein
MKALAEIAPVGEVAIPIERNSALRALSQRDPMPVEDDRPATKKDLNELRNELRSEAQELRIEFKQDLNEFRTELRAELRGDMDRLRDQLVEKMRDMQTEVLRAFHDWARPIEIQLRSLPHIEERLGMLEERVTAIEQRDKLN